LDPRTRKFVLGAFAVLLLVLTLWCANLAMTHWFFADFRNGTAKWHESWGNRFAVLALSLLLGFLYVLRLLITKKNAV
jgi:hypothetical protein